MKHNFSHALLTLLFLTLVNQAASADDEFYQPVNEYRNTDRAVIFMRTDSTDTLYFTPKTKQSVKCTSIFETSGTIICSLSLSLTGKPLLEPTETESEAFAKIRERGNLSYIPVRARSECGLRQELNATGILQNVLKTAKLSRAANGQTFTTDNSVVCQYEVRAFGTKAQALLLEEKLLNYVNETSPIQSPLSLAIDQQKIVGPQLVDSLSSGLKLATGSATTIEEASFIVGIASGRIPQLAFFLENSSTSERRRFYETAIKELFANSGTAYLVYQPTEEAANRVNTHKFATIAL